MQWPTADPFLFCVHHDDAYPAGNEQLGPAASLAGRELGQDFARKNGWSMYHGQVVPGFPYHPHRGFETVTIVRHGFVDHFDSLGATARYGEGDVQWLTAGGGVQHSEMFPLLKTDAANPAELFQIWLNLPRKNKLVPPNYQMLWHERIPVRTFADDAGRETRVAVIAGSFDGVTPLAPPPNSWAAQPGADVAIWTLLLAPGARLTLPACGAEANRTLYFFHGDELKVGGNPVGVRHAVMLKGGLPAELENGAKSGEVLVLQGSPIGEPVAQHGPFVMNYPGELKQAFLDYQSTQFGGWPWPTNGPVHPRSEGRFAKYPDGRVERP
jgi:redox-sensitive bicupin YhaK (pirin superfamily)